MHRYEELRRPATQWPNGGRRCPIRGPGRRSDRVGAKDHRILPPTGGTRSSGASRAQDRLAAEQCGRDIDYRRNSGTETHAGSERGSERLCAEKRTAADRRRMSPGGDNNTPEASRKQRAVVDVGLQAADVGVYYTMFTR
jgi:hypothetical protein